MDDQREDGPGERRSPGPPSWLVTSAPRQGEDGSVLYDLRVRLWHPYFWVCVVRGLFRRHPKPAQRPVTPNKPQQPGR